MKKYDIFISYRRDGGFETAKHLYDLLSQDGYAVSLDLDTFGNGNFNEHIFDIIDQCSDFLLILNKDAFVRTLDPDFPRQNDWMRNEIAYALEKNKNIVPIMLSGFAFDKDLPSDICAIRMKNGPAYAKDYFDGFYEKLKKFLVSKPKRKLKGMLVTVFVIVIALLLSVLGCFILRDKEVNTAAKIELDGGNPISPTDSSNVEEQQTKITPIGIPVNEKESKTPIVKPYKTADSNAPIVEEREVRKPTAKQAETVSVKKKSADDIFEEGLKLYENFDYENALLKFRKAASIGSAAANYYLGIMYLEGNAVRKDIETAFDYLRQAANSDYAAAYMRVSQMYSRGQGVDKDMKKGYLWCEKAAASGDARAIRIMDRLSKEK